MEAAGLDSQPQPLSWYQPSCGALCDWDEVRSCCCFPASLHTSVWKCRTFLYNKWRCRRPLQAQRIAIRRGHLEMFHLSPLLQAEVLPGLERILDSSGGAALLCCSHDEEILWKYHVPLNQSENGSGLCYKVGFWWTTSDWFLLWMCFSNTCKIDFVTAIQATRLVCTVWNDLISVSPFLPPSLTHTNTDFLKIFRINTNKL